MRLDMLTIGVLLLLYPDCGYSISLLFAQICFQSWSSFTRLCFEVKDFTFSPWQIASNSCERVPTLTTCAKNNVMNKTKKISIQKIKAIHVE